MVISILHSTQMSSMPKANEWGEIVWREKQFGAIHRLGEKPAIIARDGTEEYWENGRRYRILAPFIDSSISYGKLEA